MVSKRELEIIARSAAKRIEEREKAPFRELESLLLDVMAKYRHPSIKEMILAGDRQCDVEWAYEFKYALGLDLPLEMIAARAKLAVVEVLGVEGSE